MKQWPKSKKGNLLIAAALTVICLMYVVTALKAGVYAAFARPSLFANGLLFGVSGVLAVFFWVRWLFYKPGRKEFRQKKHSSAVCWGVAAFCGAGALVCVLTYLFLERSNAALAAAAFLLLCAAIWVRRAFWKRPKAEKEERS